MIGVESEATLFQKSMGVVFAQKISLSHAHWGELLPSYLEFMIVLIVQNRGPGSMPDELP